MCFLCFAVYLFAWIVVKSDSTDSVSEIQLSDYNIIHLNHADLGRVPMSSDARFVLFCSMCRSHDVVSLPFYH